MLHLISPTNHSKSGRETKTNEKNTFFNFDTRFAIFLSLVFFSHSSLCIVAVLLVRYLMKRYHNNVYACSTFRLLRMRAKTNARVWVYHRICSVCCAEHTQIKTRAIEWDGAVHTVSLDVCIHITLLRWHVLRSRKIVHLQDSGRRYWNQLNFLELFYFMCVMFSLPFSYAHFYFGRKVFFCFFSLILCERPPNSKYSNSIFAK